MELETFDKLVMSRVDECVRLMVDKSDEYARGDDKLHNFKVAARIEGITPERALRGMDLKHRTSIQDIVDDIDKGKLPSMLVLGEKMNDSINYLLLLEALITERIETPEHERFIKGGVSPELRAKAEGFKVDDETDPFIYGLARFHELPLPEKLKRIMILYIKDFGVHIREDQAERVLGIMENIGA